MSLDYHQFSSPIITGSNVLLTPDELEKCKYSLSLNNYFCKGKASVLDLSKIANQVLRALISDFLISINLI